MKVFTRTLTLDELPLLIGRDAVRLPSCCPACGAPVVVDVDLGRLIRGVIAYRHPPTCELGEIACASCRARLADVRTTDSDAAELRPLPG